LFITFSNKSKYKESQHIIRIKCIFLFVVKLVSVDFIFIPSKQIMVFSSAKKQY